MKPSHPELQLVLVGGPADDDPEGAEVLTEVMERAGDDPDLKVLLLPADSHREINALQRSAVDRAAKIAQGRVRPDRDRSPVERQARHRRARRAASPCRYTIIKLDSSFIPPAGAAYRIRYLLRYNDKRQRMGDDRT